MAAGTPKMDYKTAVGLLAIKKKLETKKILWLGTQSLEIW